MKKRNKLEVRSKFKKSNFSYQRVPSKFESITDGMIRKTKKYSLNSVEESFPNYPASAVKGMIMSVAGDFNSLYATLEGDYSARETELKNAYAKGYAGLGERIKNFQLLVQNHDAAYEKYNEVCKELLGVELSENLKYSDEKSSNLKEKYKKLEP